MDENKFWLSIWSVIATGIVSIACLITFSSYNDTVALQEMVAKGADPLAARCALGGVRSDAVYICAEIAKRGK